MPVEAEVRGFGAVRCGLVGLATDGLRRTARALVAPSERRGPDGTWLGVRSGWFWTNSVNEGGDSWHHK